MPRLPSSSRPIVALVCVVAIGLVAPAAHAKDRRHGVRSALSRVNGGPKPIGVFSGNPKTELMVVTAILGLVVVGMYGGLNALEGKSIH